MFVREIEELSYTEAKQIALEEITIKEHDCILCDLGDAFGYSILVFKNGMYIYYANDYQLHHRHLVKENGIQALRDFYIDSLNRKLYTDTELLEPVSSYDEFRKKECFLRNYWIMRYPRVSIFGLKEHRKETGFNYYNDVCFCWVQTKSIVEDAHKYLANLYSEYNKLKSDEARFREMISYELANHEACITCNFSDALSSLGLSWSALTDWQKKIVKEEFNKQINSYHI